MKGLKLMLLGLGIIVIGTCFSTIPESVGLSLSVGLVGLIIMICGYRKKGD